MFKWIKKHSTVIVSVLITVGFLLYCYSCESKVKSLNQKGRMVTRQELQLELNNFVDLAQIRFLDLDRQDQIKTLILQNAMVLVQGQPFNPVGLLTGLAAVYGIGQAGSN
ncbi:unnamed protein product, partial [marine sediment metagenome]